MTIMTRRTALRAAALLTLTGLSPAGVVGINMARAQSADAPETAKDKDDMTKIQMIIGDQVLTATLDNSAAGRSFAAMLPLELSLSDYNRTEKIATLPGKLDTTGAPASYKPEAGDITLYAPWGNLAIFYRPFQNSRGLVRLGAFDGSFDALKHDGDFTVRIEVLD